MDTNGMCAIFCWANKEVAKIFSVSCVHGRAEPENDTGQLHVGIKEKA